MARELSGAIQGKCGGPGFNRKAARTFRKLQKYLWFASFRELRRSSGCACQEECRTVNRMLFGKVNVNRGLNMDRRCPAPLTS